MGYESMRIVTAHGVPFSVRLVRDGESYGRGLRFTGQTPMVEFYDARYDNERFTPGLGQFVARYYADQFVSLDGSHHARKAGLGLTLDVGIPAWSIDGASMDRVIAWMTERLVHESAPGPRIR